MHKYKVGDTVTIIISANEAVMFNLDNINKENIHVGFPEFSKYDLNDCFDVAYYNNHTSLYFFICENYFLSFAQCFHSKDDIIADI